MDISPELIEGIDNGDFDFSAEEKTKKNRPRRDYYFDENKGKYYFDDKKKIYTKETPQEDDTMMKGNVDMVFKNLQWVEESK